MLQRVGGFANRAHFRVYFREHSEICCEHYGGSLRGEFLVFFAPESSGLRAIKSCYGPCQSTISPICPPHPFQCSDELGPINTDQGYKDSEILRLEILN